MGLSESSLKGPNLLPYGNPCQPANETLSPWDWICVSDGGREDVQEIGAQGHESAVWALVCNWAVERMPLYWE